MRTTSSILYIALALVGALVVLSLYVTSAAVPAIPNTGTTTGDAVPAAGTTS